MPKFRTSIWTRRDGFFVYPDLRNFVFYSCVLLGICLLIWIHYSLTLAVDRKLLDAVPGGPKSAKTAPWWYGFDYYASWNLLKYLISMWGLFNVIYAFRAQWLIFVPYEKPFVEYSSTVLLWSVRSRIPKDSCRIELSDWFTFGQTSHPKGRCMEFDLNGRRILMLSERSTDALLEVFAREHGPLALRAGIQLAENVAKAVPPAS